MNTLQEKKWIYSIKLFGSKKDADLLVQKYYDEIRIFVAKQIDDEYTVYDLTQEIFISMLQSIDLYQEKLSSFRTWIYRIATNKVIDLRRKRVIKTTPLDEMEEVIEDVDFKNKERVELIAKIETYVSSFAVDIQQIYRLHLYGNLNFREISEMMGTPESTVKSKYYRLLKQIRREFFNDYSEII